MAELTIFEGPDGCGKTTLLGRYGSALEAGGLYHHGPYLKDDARQLMSRYLVPMRKPKHSRILYDRSWLSEPIYGLTKRGVDRLGVVARRYLDRVALSRRGIVVVPDTPFEQCAHVYAARKQLEYLDSAAQLRAVYDQYLKLEEWTHLPVVRVNRSLHAVDLEKILEDVRPSANGGPGIGHWRPADGFHHGVTLLVGEKTNAAVHADLPFVAPDLRHDNCSAWLAQQLEDAGIREDELYWVNALGKSGKPIHSEFIEELKPKRIVALGEVAAAWCVAAHAEHKHVPHPQYWKRFHHTKPYPLIKLLKETA